MEHIGINKIKLCQIQNFMKSPSAGKDFSHAKQQTDGQDDVDDGRFSILYEHA